MYFLGFLGFTSLVVYTTKVLTLRMSQMFCVEGYTEHVNENLLFSQCIK